MPEGPEVYVLALALKSLGFSVEAYGKHLLIVDMENGNKLDISFGLAGGLKLTSFHLEKTVVQDKPCGYIKVVENFDDVKHRSGLFGLNWLTASREELKAVVTRWSQRRKQIGALLIDQHEICGIGVAWASEILFRAKILPTDKASWFEFLNLINPLVDALIEVRGEAIKKYKDFLKGDMHVFVNEWFKNLYNIRQPIMQVYQTGQEVKISGRSFYV